VPSRIRQHVEIHEGNLNLSEEQSEIPVFHSARDDLQRACLRKVLPDLSRLEITSFMNNVNGKTETLTSKNLDSRLYKSLTR
jgi:hypothetical protein